MVRSMTNWQPLVNGYSDFVPPDFEEMALPINGFPDAKSFAILRARGVRYVIVRLAEYRQFRQQMVDRFPPYDRYLHQLTDDQDVRLYEIVSWPEEYVHAMRRAILITVLVAGAIWAARVDLPRLTGPIKGDEATYVSMAFSVAKDFDLKYRPEDYRRFVQLYGTAPDGIFLKRTLTLGSWRVRAAWPPIAITKAPVPSTEELDYGKPFAYAIAAAPFAALLGLGGFLFFNVLLLGLCAWCAVLFCQARTGTAAGVAFGLSFLFASVVPVYVAWLTPEIFNFTLVLVAYFFWLYKEVAPAGAPAWLRRQSLDWIAAALLGIATFSKVSNGFLIVPIVLLAIGRRQWRSAALVSCVFWLALVGLFGTNELIAGDWNYQGGHRNSFASHFPFDNDATSFESGNPMTTNEANDENILAPRFLWPALRHNICISDGPRCRPLALLLPWSSGRRSLARPRTAVTRLAEARGGGCCRFDSGASGSRARELERRRRTDWQPIFSEHLSDAVVPDACCNHSPWCDRRRGRGMALCRRHPAPSILSVAGRLDKPRTLAAAAAAGRIDADGGLAGPVEPLSRAR